MKYSFLFALLLSACIGSLYAQDNFTINGIITDSLSGESLIGVNVKFSMANTYETRTNAYGFYSYKLLPGDYTMSVSYVGYTPLKKDITVRADMQLNISLVASNMIEEVIVSSQKRNENVSSAQMGMAKISLSEIGNVPVLFGERDVIKTLQLLPGIKSAGEGNSGFFVRGGSADQNLILLDEAPVYNASHLLGFFSTFNSDAIKDVSVFKGGMPAQYGGRLSSVLDIRMNDGNKKEYTAEGGVGLISSRLKLEGPLIKDRSSFMVSGRRTYADVFLGLAKDSSIRNNTLYFYDINAKANYQIDGKNTLYLSGYFGRDELGLDQSFGFGWGNATATLRWNHLYSNRLFSNTSLIYSNYNYVIENFISENNFRVNSSIRDLNFKQDFQLSLNNSHNLRFGLDLVSHTIAPGSITSAPGSSINQETIEKRKGNEASAYISDEWEAGERLNIVYGMRISAFFPTGPGTFNVYDRQGNITDTRTYSSGEYITSYVNAEPRLSASYLLSPSASLKASYTRNVQNLHLMSNSTSSLPTDLYIMSSINVRPETADQVAAGYFRNFNQDKFEFSAELYYKAMQNQIDYRSGTDLRGNKNVEADLLYGRGRAYGAELYLRKRSGRFSGWIGYTLSKTERSFDDIENGKWFYARQDRTHDLSLVGIFKPGGRWVFSSSFVYSTGNAVTFPVGKYQLNNQTYFYYSGRNSDRMPDYHRLDLAATLEARPGSRLNSSWSFGLYNSYNRKNAYAIDFQDDPDVPGKTQAVQTSLFGIIPSVTWNFKF